MLADPDGVGAHPQPLTDVLGAQPAGPQQQDLAHPARQPSQQLVGHGDVDRGDGVLLRVGDGSACSGNSSISTADRLNRRCMSATLLEAIA